MKPRGRGGKKVRRNCPVGGYSCYTTGYVSRRQASAMIAQHVGSKHIPEEGT